MFIYKIFTILTLYVCFIFGALNANDIHDTCKDKIDDLNKQIFIAEQFGKSDKIDGLKKALAKIKQKCNDGSISSEIKSKISKYEDKIKETKDDIDEAKAKGKILKGRAEEAKLKVLQNDLEQVKRYLEDLAK